MCARPVPAVTHLCSLKIFGEKMSATPRKSAGPRAKPRSQPTAAAAEALEQENADSQEASEAAQAESLLAELMCGTPRARTPSARSLTEEERGGKKQRAAEEESEDNHRSESAADDDGWYAECVIARRRLKPEVEGGPPGEWQYLIRWVDKGPEDDRWVPESALHPDFLRDDLQAAATERAMERASLGIHQAQPQAAGA